MSESYRLYDPYHPKRPYWPTHRKRGRPKKFEDAGEEIAPASETKVKTTPKSANCHQNEAELKPKAKKARSAPAVTATAKEVKSARMVPVEGHSKKKRQKESNNEKSLDVDRQEKGSKREKPKRRVSFGPVEIREFSDATDAIEVIFYPTRTCFITIKSLFCRIYPWRTSRMRRWRVMMAI